MTVVKKLILNNGTRFLLRFYLKSIIYCSIFMLMELGGRFMKGVGTNNGFVPVPIWMLIVYINIAWLDDIIIPYFKSKKIPPWIQAFFITLLIYLFELSFGIFFKYILGITVWDYSNASFMGAKVNLYGVISLYGLIPWYGVSWFILWLYPRVKYMVDSKGL